MNLRGYAPRGGRVSLDQALGRFLEALGVLVAAIPVDEDARAAMYRTLLAEKRVLIVLDNAATAAQVRPLLPGADTCFALITSCNRLPGLVVRDGARRITLGVLTESEAVDLLKAATAGYRDSDPEADLIALARLCGRLTLAMRIAAKQAVARPFTSIAAVNLALLSGEAFLRDDLSTEDEQGDALRTVFAWSYEALPQSAARMFRLLGLHPGTDFTALSAGALAGVPPQQAFRLIETLADAHLLEQTTDNRWAFHDLLRIYAVELARKRDSADMRTAALERVCDWYLRVMNEVALVHGSVYGDEWGVTVPREDRTDARGPDQAMTETPDIPDHATALAWFTAETDCLAAVCREAADAGLHGIAWRLVALMRTPFLDRHPVDEWLPLGRIALRSALQSGDGLGQAVAQIGLGVAYRQARRVAEAIVAESAALEAARAIRDRRQETAALTLLGHAQRRGRRLDQACRAYGEALDVARRASLEQWITWATVGLAGTLFDAGQLDEARTRLAGMDVSASRRYPGLHAERLLLLAALERESGDIAAAETLIREALDIAQAADNALYASEFGVEYARVLVAADRSEEALVVLARAADLKRSIGDCSGEADALDVAGEAYQRLGRADEALAAHAGASAAHMTMDDPWRAAVAFANLGRTRVEAGRDGAAANCRQALGLIAGYEDARAQALRDKLTALLSTSDPTAAVK